MLATINLMGTLYTKKYAVQKEFAVAATRLFYLYILLIYNVIIWHKFITSENFSP